MVRTLRSSAVSTALPALAVAALLIVGGCASTGSGGGGSGSNLTREDIEQVSVSDAYELVQRLRPRWLQSRGQISFQNPDAGYAVVYVDGMRFGPLNSLRQISPETIDEMEFISAGDATTRFGLGHTGGVIMISTRR